MEKTNFNEIISNSIQTILDEELNPAFDKKVKGNNLLGKVWGNIENFREELAKELNFTLNDNSELKTLEGEKAAEVRERFNNLDEVSKKRIEAFGAKTNIMGIPNMLVKAGNAKLPENVMIVNLTSALLCPSYHLGTCTITDGICYAQAGENQYGSKQETKAEKENTRLRSQKTDIMNFALLDQYRKGNIKPMEIYFKLIDSYIALGDAYAETEYNKRIKEAESIHFPITDELKKYFTAVTDRFRIKFIRINESGDFPCQLSVDLWTEFAKYIHDKYEGRITIHAYTARFLDFSKATENDNIVINPSHSGINTGYKNKRIFKVASDATIKYFESNGFESQVDPSNHQPILIKNPNFKQKDYENQKTGQVMKEENVYPMCYICPCNYMKDKEGNEIDSCNDCQVCFHSNQTGSNYIIYVKEHGASSKKNKDEEEVVKNETNGFKHTPAGKYVVAVNQSMMDNGYTSEKENQIATSKAQQNRIKSRSQKSNVKAGEKDRNKNRKSLKKILNNDPNTNVNTNTKNDK